MVVSNDIWHVTCVVLLLRLAPLFFPTLVCHLTICFAHFPRLLCKSDVCNHVDRKKFFDDVKFCVF